jgi:hypothetical protein
VNAFLDPFSQHFPKFPFGSDFTPTELKLGKALGNLRDSNLGGKIKTFAKGLTSAKEISREELERMNLWKPKGLKEKLTQTIILGALQKP